MKVCSCGPHEGCSKCSGIRCVDGSGREWVYVSGKPVDSEPRNHSPRVGIGGAPTRATTLPDDPKARKQYPISSGVLDYFPDAIVALANLSWRGNDQHNPGQPLHWAREKSGDEADTMLRHFLQRGTVDSDGVRHTAKMAWRALALLQKEIEAEQAEKRPMFDTMIEPGGNTPDDRYRL